MARTDDDSWDLASSVGATATMVAAQRALANREGLIDDPFAEPLVRAVGLDFFIRALDGEIDLGDVDPGFNIAAGGRGNGGSHHAISIRLFTDAAAAGVRQAVILAAGLDARAYRLPWPDGTTVYELDQPEVIDFKTKTLGRPWAQLKAGPAHRCRSTFATTGRKHCWTTASIPAQPTAWIGRGSADLPAIRRPRTCCSTGSTSSALPGSRVATEHIPDVSMFSDERSQQHHRNGSKQYGHDIEMNDLIYHGERSHVIEYLTAHGWDVTAQTDAGMRTPPTVSSFPRTARWASSQNLSYVKRGQALAHSGPLVAQAWRRRGCRQGRGDQTKLVCSRSGATSRRRRLGRLGTPRRSSRLRRSTDPTTDVGCCDRCLRARVPDSAGSCHSEHRRTGDRCRRRWDVSGPVGADVNRLQPKLFAIPGDRCGHVAHPHDCRDHRRVVEHPPVTRSQLEESA